jgi:uncharacterized Fe-S center protein
MSNVYFRSATKNDDLSTISKELFDYLIQKEQIKLNNTIPIKVHFGEEGNETFIKPVNYNGIIDYLDQKAVNSFFIETNVLYKGKRTRRDEHIKLGKEHGFNRIPIVIADGEHGEEYDEIEINKNHFSSCKIGKEYSNYNQILVLSHFKGHILAGFGGALKQLAMGFASRGGKLAQHANSHPLLNPLQCIKCGACVSTCPVDAINLKPISRINKNICIGCASCIAVCPTGALKINWMSTLPKTFHEKLVEYSYAASLNKDNIYLLFAIDITKGCDCEGHKMKPFIEDIGIFASTDPLAIDKACLDMIQKREGKDYFNSKRTIEYANEIGVGSINYNLISI